jgi:hypothetical protein
MDSGKFVSIENPKGVSSLRVLVADAITSSMLKCKPLNILV